MDLSPAVRPTARDAIRDAVRVRWRGSILPIAGPEHTIVMKLKFGSDRDIEDALGIYVRQGGGLMCGRCETPAAVMGSSRS